MRAKNAGPTKEADSAVMVSPSRKKSPIHRTSEGHTRPWPAASPISSTTSSSPPRNASPDPRGPRRDTVRLHWRNPPRSAEYPAGDRRHAGPCPPAGEAQGRSCRRGVGPPPQVEFLRLSQGEAEDPSAFRVADRLFRRLGARDPRG